MPLPAFSGRLARAPFALKAAVVVAAALGVAFFMVHGLVYPFDGLTPYRGKEYSDVGQMVWNLWQTAESVLALRDPLSTDLVYFPIGADLATHTLSAGYVPIALAAKLLSGGSPMYPVYAYNATALLAFTAALLFSFLALREAGFGLAASAVPALGFAFCDFFYLHWLHFNLLGAFALPLAAWLFLRLWKRATAGRLVAFTASVAWSVYVTEFALSICMAGVLSLVAALAIPSLRRGVASRARALGPLNIALAVAFFCLATAPFVVAFFRSDALAPPDIDFHQNSANLAGFVVPSTESTPLYGDLFAALDRDVRLGRPGVTTFIGFPLLLLLAVGLVVQRRAAAWVAFGVALCFYALSLGPSLKVFSTETGIAMPYAALMDVPPFDQNRCPARFSVIGLFFLLFGAAAGLDAVTGFLRRRVHVVAAAILALGLAGWTLAECYPPPMGEHAPYAPPSALSQLVSGPVVHTSLPWRGCNDALLQVFHGHPMANGCLARTTKAQQKHIQELRAAFGRDWGAYTRLLRRDGYTNIIVDRRYPPEMMRRIRELPFNIVELEP